MYFRLQRFSLDHKPCSALGVLGSDQANRTFFVAGLAHSMETSLGGMIHLKWVHSAPHMVPSFSTSTSPTFASTLGHITLSMRHVIH